MFDDDDTGQRKEEKDQKGLLISVWEGLAAHTHMKACLMSFVNPNKTKQNNNK